MATQLFLLFLLSTTLHFSVATARGFGITIHRRDESPLSPSYNRRNNQRSTARGFGITIHRRDESPLSPSYNRPNTTAADRLNSIYQRSIARYNFLQSEILNSVSNDAVQIPVTPASAGYEYEMTFAIGTPPLDVTAIVDTGSGLPWIQCEPCDQCYPQNAPVFDPAGSSSYQEVRCDDPACNMVRRRSCESNTCKYTIEYADTKSSRGNLATEDFIFPTFDAGNKTISGIAFGCGHTNTGHFQKTQQGIIGLDMSSASLVSQLGTEAESKFSYCLVPHFESGGSQMKFGDKALMAGNSIPMALNPDDRFYFVGIDDISVGPKRLNLPPVFVRRSNSGGVLMDTGSPLTLLVDSAFQKLASELKQTVLLPPRPKKLGFICFEGTGKDLAYQKIPTITFHFTGGVDLVWEPIYSFYEMDDEVCLMAASVRDGRLSTIGGLAQQNINVGIDVGNKRVYMSPLDCLTFGPPP